LSCEGFESGLLGRCNVFEITAHDNINRSPYVGIRLREHQEGKAPGMFHGRCLGVLTRLAPCLGTR
jgi:hypothetical protein